MRLPELMVSLQLAWCWILWATKRKLADSSVEVRPDSSREISQGREREKERKKERKFIVKDNGPHRRCGEGEGRG